MSDPEPEAALSPNREREAARDQGTIAEPSASPAHDPSAFRLRAAPPRVMRLSRKVLAIAGAATATTIGGALIYALHEGPPHAPAKNLYSSGGAARASVVTQAPADYATVPKLGPPLPGDLGPPIVAAQQNATRIDGTAPPTDDSAGAQARERAQQARAAARMSALFADHQTARAIPADAGALPLGGAPQAVAQNSASTTSAPGQAGKRAFLASANQAGPTSAARLSPPPSPYVLQAGSVIAAALITGIRSDLPGQITAQVTENVYDSPTGRLLLIPQGSRLIGSYDSDVSSGDDRVLLAWDRLILPDGRSIALDRQPGADAAGMAGLQDRTNHHWGNVLKATVMSTLLGIGTDMTTGGSGRLIDALRYGTQDTLNQTGRTLVGREIGVAPTLTIRPGFALRVIVTRDLILEPQETSS